MFLMRVQEWQVPFEAVVGRSHSAMRVPPSPSPGDVRFLVDECAVLFEPFGEIVGQCRLVLF